MAIKSDNCTIKTVDGKIPKDLSGIPTGVDTNCMICMAIPVSENYPGSEPFLLEEENGKKTTIYIIKKLLNYNNLFKCKKCKDGILKEQEKPCYSCIETVIGTNRITGLPITKMDWVPIAPLKIDGVAQNCTKCIEGGKRRGEIIDECFEKKVDSDSNPKTVGKYQYVCEKRGSRGAECYRTCTNSSCSLCEQCKKATTLFGDDNCVDDCKYYEICYDKDKLYAECLCRNVAYAKWDDIPESDRVFFDRCSPKTPNLRDKNCECFCNCGNRTRNFDCLWSKSAPFIGGCRCVYYDNNSGTGSSIWENAKPCGSPTNKKKIVNYANGCECEDYTAGIQSVLNISLDFIP